MCEEHSQCLKKFITHHEIICTFLASPVAQNPTIDYERLTNHITLLWSPPFLWPGERIHHYNVIFAIKRQCTITNYWVNGDYSAETVSFTRRINHDIPVCTEFEFFISAISIDTSEQLQTFNVTGWIKPSSKNTLLNLLILMSLPFVYRNHNDYGIHLRY